MKKSIIAAGAASVALAAMPIVGAFAVDSVSDNISAVIGNGCVITDSAAQKQVNVSVAPGNVATSTAAGSISVTCNSDAWHVSAVGAGTGTPVTNLVGEDDSDNIIATGTLTSGSTSNWAFKVASLKDSVTGADIPGSVAHIVDGTGTGESTDYTNFAAVPATAQAIVKGENAANVTVNTQYQVYAALGQAADTYVGKVTYTVTKD